ncbi:hypothetical protein [Tenuifilum sp.]|uniref:hypothetical protein n=1 Tax=Tenuifilum sp. TaxID=2760880 RepID=UPI002C5EF4FE|nr:hypothetical protein [Tenuifilum sp.]
MKWLKIIALLPFFFSSVSSWCQVDSIGAKSGGMQRAMADSLLNAKSYTKAIPKYKELLVQFPRDPEIKYALGVCYLYGTRDVEMALKYLKDASTSDLNTMVYFYLAEALRQSYQFNEAIDYYRRFVVSGGSPDIKLDEVEKLVTACENGSFLTRYVYSPTVFDRKQASPSNFLNYYSSLLPEGSFTPVPENLRTVTDKQMGYTSVMFYPKNIKPGDYLYYSSYGKSTSWGTDIFRIQLLDNGKWSKPENLGDIINSSLNEEYPFIMPDGVTLYFASKGHYGMGGYDIYKSVYNADKKQWSTPENLGFPVNSTYDDFLFLTSNNDTLACFTSNRLSMPDTLNVFLIRNDINPTRRTPNSYKELLTIARLNPVESKPSASPKVPSSKVETDKPKAEAVENKKPAKFNSVENDPEYSRVLAKGFAAQKLADSLKIKLEDLRGRFDYVTTAEQRVRLEKQVTKVEDDMLAAQKEADLLFARASQIEQEYLTGKRKPKDESNTSFVADNPDFIYQAQFASTVFRTDEINRLADAEKLTPQLIRFRNFALERRDAYNRCLSANDNNNACTAEYNQLVAAMKQYSDHFKKYWDKKYQIYSDCIEVARVKSGNRDTEVRKLTTDAQNNFRAAMAILNNLDSTGQVESVFEASLLRDLGLMQFDLAFAKIWRLRLMEQQLLSNVIKLERNIFGQSSLNLAQEEQKPTKTVEEVEVDMPKLKSEPAIKQATPTIAIIDEIPADFGVTDKPYYSDEKPIPIDEPLPSGVIYRIQIGAFSAPQKPSFFKGMVPVYGYKTGNIIRYYIGNLTRYSDAEKALVTVKQKGFKDAFIVAWLNGTRITTQRAQQLEDAVQQVQQSKTDSRLYIVEVGRYKTPLTDSEINTVRNLSQGKELTRKVDSNGDHIYIIGNFNSIDEANRVKENLIASGMLKAVVIDITP